MVTSPPTAAGVDAGMPVAVVTDSSACLSPRDDVTVIDLGVAVADAQRSSIMAALRGGGVVTTSRPAPEQFARVYRRLLAGGVDAVVSIHLSAELSGTVESARVAAQEFDGAVVVLDSRAVAMALGFAVQAAADAAAAGGDAAGVVAAARESIASTDTLFYVDKPEFLQRGGRVTTALSQVGKALVSRPVLELVGGALEVRERVRTKEQAQRRLVELVLDRLPVGRVVVHHVDTAAAADALAKRLSTVVKPQMLAEPLSIVELDPVLGAHVGPGAVGVVVVRS